MNKLLYVIALCAVVAAVWGGSLAYDALLIAPGPDASEVAFEVSPGQSASSVAARLSEQGIIKGPRAFVLFARLSGAGSSIKAGTFALKQGMSYAAILAALTASVPDKEVEITVPEGYTAKQAGEVARAALPHMTEEEWETAAAGKEGYLFPDTYRFHADASAADVVAKMRVTFDLRMSENGIVQDGKFAQAVTLASILEREVRGAEDMAQVSDIFRKRLAAGMPLQADSTVNYATGGNRPSVTYEDLRVDSPYNTYKYPGLPPGPIGNPGVAAIKAALNPSKNPYYYFLTTPEGEVKYARTFEEHLGNRRYLR